MARPIKQLVEKRCSCCKLILKIENFPRRKVQSGLSWHSTCKKCQRKMSDAYRKTDRGKAKIKEWEKANPIKHKTYKLRKRYGIEYEDYINLLIKFNYKCGICDATQSKHKKSSDLYIDHCHKTNKIRGLLCNACNLGLGSFYDNEELLKRAILYLGLYGIKE